VSHTTYAGHAVDVQRTENVVDPITGDERQAQDERAGHDEVYRTVQPHSDPLHDAATAPGVERSCTANHALRGGSSAATASTTAAPQNAPSPMSSKN
jgi:hypothetical protein